MTPLSAATELDSINQPPPRAATDLDIGPDIGPTGRHRASEDIWRLGALVLDEPEPAAAIAALLADAGHDVRIVSNSGDAIAAARQHGCDVMITPAHNAPLIARLCEVYPEIHVVYLADAPNPLEAIAAVRSRADYLPRRPRGGGEGESYRHLLGPITALGRQRAAKLKERASLAGAAGILVGRSLVMKALRKNLEIAAHETGILVITGERGAGKAVAARALHAAGPAAGGPLISIEAGATDGPRLASAIEAARGGTLIISAVEELGAEETSQLAQAIEDANSLELSIVMTCRDQGALAPTLAGAPRLEVPPLRHRRDDLPLLVRHLIERHWQPHTLAPTLSAAAWTSLAGRAFPGNVGELDETLANALERAGGGPILPTHISPLEPHRPLRWIRDLCARLFRSARTRRVVGEAIPSPVSGWGR